MENKSGWYRIDGELVSKLQQPVDHDSYQESFSKTMDLIALQVRELIGSHQGAVSYVPDGDFSKAMHTTSLTEKYAKYRDYDVLPTGQGIWSLIFKEKMSMCLTQEDLYNHPKFRHFSNHKTKTGLEHPPLLGWLAVPVLGKAGNVVGMLQLSDKYDGDYTQEDLNTLTHYAKHIAHIFEIQYQDDMLSEKDQKIFSLDKLAHFDYLTKVHNRLSFDLKLYEFFHEAHTQQQQLALMIIDLDSFKSINDTLGHLFGDQILLQTANRIKSCLPPSAFLARLGGDEFAVILNDIASIQDAEHLAQCLIKTFSQPFSCCGHEVASTISIGIADNSSAESPVALLQHVDMALYRVKSSGKNNYMFYDKALDDKQQHHLQIETHIQSAIDHDEYFLAYQPIYDLNTMKAVCFEALIRWDNRILGSISPADFIPIAEKSGRIHEITKWLIDTVCNNIRSWLDNNLAVCPVAINVSASDVMRKDFVNHLKQTTTKHQLPANLLRIELTETAAFLDNDATIDNLLELDQLGFDIIIDDFGTGFSSLSRLGKLPIKYVKIDRMFISDLQHEGNLKIIESIIAIAQSFDYQVVIEGIETQAQLDYAKTVGAQLAQGFYLCRPKRSDYIEHHYLLT